MKTFISLLRGINVSGQKKILMADLKQHFESMDFKNVQTYVQSGNVIFNSDEKDSSRLGRRIEAGILKRFGFPVAVFIRHASDFKRIIKSNPFSNARKADPGRLHVTFFNGIPDWGVLDDLKTPNGQGDEYAVGESEIFLFCPSGYGKTKLSNNYFEKKLKLPATTRNWKTVLALYEMVRRSG